MEIQPSRQSEYSEINCTQPQHYTEYMTWYTSETEAKTQTAHKELGSRAIELATTTESLTEETTELTAKENDVCEISEATATYEELLDELRTARWIANAALIADRKGSPTSARVKQRRYQQNRKAMPSRFSGGVVATGFGSL